MSTNILLIDLSSIAHLMFHTSGDNPNPDATSLKTVERVRALASGQPHVAICLDTPPYFRMAISPDYKAKRDKENNAVIGHQIAVAADTLRADGFPIWGAKGYEADDVIASATARIMGHVVLTSEGPQSPTATIVSADKDLLQLVDDHVQIKSLKDGSLIGSDETKAKFGVWPHQMVDYLSLVGDTSDNIAGAKGIGAKRAVEILETFGNLDDALRAVAGGANTITPAITKSLAEFQPRLMTVRDLIRLRTDAPIPFEEVFRERVPQDVAVFGGEMNDEHGDVLPSEGQAGTAETATGAGSPTETAAVVREAGAPDVQHHAADGAHPPAGEGRPTLTHDPLKSDIKRINDSMSLREADIVSVAPVEWNKQLEPRSMMQAKQVAADLFASRQFSAYGNAPAVLSTILAGRELGFQTMASLRAFHIIEGKPTMAAGAMHSLVLASGKAEYFRCTERTAERATFVTKRHGDPTEMTLTFTIDEAKQAWNGKRDADGTPDAKSWAASGWGKNPADMCVARALTKLARLVYPDVCHGLYSPEEIS